MPAPDQPGVTGAAALIARLVAERMRSGGFVLGRVSRPFPPHLHPRNGEL